MYGVRARDVLRVAECETFGWCDYLLHSLLDDAVVFIFQIEYLADAANASGRRAAMLRELSEEPLTVVPRLEAQLLADEEAKCRAYFFAFVFFSSCR